MAGLCPRCEYQNVADAKFCHQCGAMLEQEAATDGDPLIGRILLGRYRVAELLGEGGMGKVYLAEQKMGTATRKVAIKTLHAELNNDPQLVARFHRECETVIDLHHPNTVQFYDFGELEDKTLFIVMEFIQGEDLAQTLARGPIGVERADRLLIQICGSLYEAHNMGLVHRDLKPENVLLTERGGQTDFVKVLDFGIAKRNDAEDESQAKLTKQGMVLGTPPYMSPEQFSGQQLDARSDIYSLGIMMYEFLTGHLPFEARTPWEWATMHLTTPPAPLETYPEGAALAPQKKAAIMRSLAKNRDERQATVMEFLNEFTGIQDPQAAWTMATSGGMSVSQTPASQMGMMATAAVPVAARAPVGTPQPMQSQPGTQPLQAPQTGPQSVGSFDPVATGGGYATGGMQQSSGGSGIGKWLAIAAALIVFIGGAGVVTLLWWMGQDGSEQTAAAGAQPVAPPPGQGGVVPGAAGAPGVAPVAPTTPVAPAVAAPAATPPTQMQPAAAAQATPPAAEAAPEPAAATPPAEVAPEPTTAAPAQETEPAAEEPSGSRRRPRSDSGSNGSRAGGAAALSTAQAAVSRNDVARAIGALRQAQRALGRNDSGVALDTLTLTGVL